MKITLKQRFTWMSRLCNSKHKEEKHAVFGVISEQFSTITELVWSLLVCGFEGESRTDKCRWLGAFPQQKTVQLHNVALHAKSAEPLAAVPLKQPALIKGPIILSSLCCVNELVWWFQTGNSFPLLHTDTHNTLCSLTTQTETCFSSEMTRKSGDRLKEEISLDGTLQKQKSFTWRLKTAFRKFVFEHAEMGSINFKWWSKTSSAQRWQNNNTRCQTTAVPTCSGGICANIWIIHIK